MPLLSLRAFVACGSVKHTQQRTYYPFTSQKCTKLYQIWREPQ